jgi:hypothetical protein
VDAPIVIYCDNISSILLANNPIYHARTKHIEVHYHFIREKVIANEIDLIHVSTENQVVDIFTKALGTDKLKKFRKMLGVLEEGSRKFDFKTSTHFSKFGFFIARMLG